MMDSSDDNSAWGMIIRPRRSDETDACVELLADVHAADRYPLHWPADLLAWLAPDNLLAAWVAEHERGVVGHIALRSAINKPAASIWSPACGLPPERLGVIARLFVAPGARGYGVGAALLDEACAEARARGLRPVLDVLDHNRGAIALYERKGWRRVASVEAPWARDSGGQPFLHYYIAPN
jgi:ribosomal protein S18 acetylase RimI-like enzyme